MQKLTNLGEASLDAGQLLDDRPRLRCCLGRVASKVSLDRLGMSIQLAARSSVARQLLESLDAPGQVLPEVGPQGVLRDADQATDLAMGQLTRFQPNCPHFLLDARMGVMKPLVLERVNGLLVERNA